MLSPDQGTIISEAHILRLDVHQFGYCKGAVRPVGCSRTPSGSRAVSILAKSEHPCPRSHTG